MNIKFLKNTVVFLIAKAAFMAARVLPRSFGLRVFGTIGKLLFLIPNYEKTRTTEHLTLIFGAAWPENKIRSTAAAVYESLGKNLFDAVYLSHAPEKRFDAIVTHDDLAGVRNAYNRGKGLIVITAHCGCFEMLLHFFARHGLKSFAIGRKSFDSRIEGLIRELRSGKDIEYMDRSESTRKIVRNLLEGKAFGVLIDQDTSVEGVFAPFLGRPAFTPSAPVRLAMKLHFPVVVATTARKPDNTHHVFLSNVMEFSDSGDFETSLVRNISVVNDLICETILRFPEQWVWMHRRWKTQVAS
ncbi:MAG: lysophospholipid acyltransferase family protein [Chitinispirillaceae bacterium]|nr:lysophospholipid acyltransferase family protein [Chitinispirillaceae bacterium]